MQKAIRTDALLRGQLERQDMSRNRKHHVLYFTGGSSGQGFLCESHCASYLIPVSSSLLSRSALISTCASQRPSANHLLAIKRPLLQRSLRFRGIRHACGIYVHQRLGFVDTPSRSISVTPIVPWTLSGACQSIIGSKLVWSHAAHADPPGPGFSTPSTNLS